MLAKYFIIDTLEESCNSLKKLERVAANQGEIGG